jgi:hypothetical protein
MTEQGNSRSLRTVYSAISTLALSSRSGGIDGRPTTLYIASERRRQLLEDLVGDRLDFSQRVALRHPRLRRLRRQHRGLLRVRPTHRRPLYPDRSLESILRSFGPTFSTAC